MPRSPNLRFFALECILYDICLCQLMAFRAFFLDMIFDGCFAWPQDVDNRCGDSHWRAANNCGQKAAKLDETGLEIAGQNEIYIVINVLGLNIYSCIWKRCIGVLIESVIYTCNHVGCRHGLAQWAVNMFQGELYGYANFIHQKKMIPAGVNYFWEDIVCKYWKWAEKAGGLENCDMKPALSVMHAKAHSWTCQV